LANGLRFSNYEKEEAEQYRQTHGNNPIKKKVKKE